MRRGATTAASRVAERTAMGSGDEAAFLAALTQAAPVWRRVAGGRAAARVLEMAATLGPVRMATGLLAGDLGWEGFAALSVARRLDASVEAIVRRPEFAGLFDADDRQRARLRLARVDDRAPWDAAPPPP
jgi:hypothetical protein